MKCIVIALVIVTLTATAADARRRHHRFMVRDAPVMLVAPDARAMVRSGQRGDAERLVPRDWQLLAGDPKWQGRRYVAPGGDAWLALYATNAANDAQSRFKAVAFADGEQIRLLHGGHDRLTVIGTRDDRLFFRKVALACGGATWRHVAIDYPAQREAEFGRSVVRVSRIFDRLLDDDCANSLFSSPADASSSPQKPEEKPAEPN